MQNSMKIYACLCMSQSKNVVQILEAHIIIIQINNGTHEQSIQRMDGFRWTSKNTLFRLWCSFQKSLIPFSNIQLLWSYRTLTNSSWKNVGIPHENTRKKTITTSFPHALLILIDKKCSCRDTLYQYKYKFSGKPRMKH